MTMVHFRSISRLVFGIASPTIAEKRLRKFSRPCPLLSAVYYCGRIGLVLMETLSRGVYKSFLQPEGGSPIGRPSSSRLWVSS